MSYRNYKVKLDSARTKNNKSMSFYIGDYQSNRFTITITDNGNAVELSQFEVVLLSVSPSNTLSTQFIHPGAENVLTVDLEEHMMNEVGIWSCKTVLIKEDFALVLDPISYTVNNDELTQLGADISQQEQYPVLIELLGQNIKVQDAEEQRILNEAQRILAEDKREANELERMNYEIIRQHEESDRHQYEAIRQQNELAREQAMQDIKSAANDIANQEAERQANEQTRILAEQARNDNYEFMTENEARRKAEADAHNIAEQERRTVEQSRVLAENTRQQQEEERQASTQQCINDCKQQCDTAANILEAEVDAKKSELDSKADAMQVQVNNKIVEIENRFNELSSNGESSAEVIDARDGEVSLKARLDRDVEKAKELYTNVEGSSISTDSNVGYAKDVEILGNTIQDATDLADIRSVGDKVEGQELYEIPVLITGKNLFKGKLERGWWSVVNGRKTLDVDDPRYCCSDFIKIDRTKKYKVSSIKYPSSEFWILYYDENKNYLNIYNHFETIPNNAKYITFYCVGSGAGESLDDLVQFEEGTQSTPYEPYQEDKLTILSPTPLEKVGDVADRIVCKDGVWGVEKNIGNKSINGSMIKSAAWKEFADTVGCLFIYSDERETIKYTVISVMSNGFSSVTYRTLFDSDVEGISGYVNNQYGFVVRVLKTRLNGLTTIEYFNQNPLEIKYQLAQPQFIQLPHDQQVKLRTFASKTNISFLTEIEGTIKAQVPKSIGATVNTHTEQINNLNKELDRVKKLEESTVSTVTTESNFTTVEETSNGYFEGVKLEGKTLVVNDKNEEVEVGADGARLMSVGQDVEEVRVESVKGDGNLFTGRNMPIYCSENEVYYFNHLDANNPPCWTRFFDKNNNIILEKNLWIGKFTTPANCSYFKINVIDNNVMVTKGDSSKPYTPYQSNKKQLLYYNPTTETWEKPILRQWDSIEKHSDGKYYYHKRSGEVVLNGSENWTGATQTGNLNQKYIPRHDMIRLNDYAGRILCDKFEVLNSYYTAKEGISGYTSVGSYIGENWIYINTPKSTEELKQWLKANPTTVVYQLAQEEVYECANLDLITYANETNYVVNTGAITPKSSLKVIQNAANIIKQLQEKVSVLEGNQVKFMQIILDIINKE